MDEPWTYYAKGKKSEAHVVWLHEMLRKGKHIETGSPLVMARSEIKDKLASGNFGNNENIVLKLDCGNGYTIL